MASADLAGRSPDEQLFLLLQSMGYAPTIPLWQYQQAHREQHGEASDINSSASKEIT